MDTTVQNTRKGEILLAQEAMLNKAQDEKRGLNATEEDSYKTMDAEVKMIDLSIARMSAISKSKTELALPTTATFIPQEEKKKGKIKLSAEYRDAFWNALKTQNLKITNAALGEGGTAADGSF